MPDPVITNVNPFAPQQVVHTNPFAAPPAPAAPQVVHTNPFATDPYAGAVKAMGAKLGGDMSFPERAASEVPILGPAVGRAASGASAAMSSLLGSDQMGRTLGQRYQNYEAARKLGNSIYDKGHPWASAAASLAGPSLVPGGAEDSIAKSVMRWGALYGADAAVRGKNIPEGVAQGAVGALVPHVAMGGIKAGSKLAGAALDKAGLAAPLRKAATDAGDWLASRLHINTPDFSGVNPEVDQKAAEMAANLRANIEADKGRKEPITSRIKRAVATAQAIPEPSSGAGKEAAMLVQKHVGRGNVASARFHATHEALDTLAENMTDEQRMAVLKHIEDYSKTPIEAVPEAIRPIVDAARAVAEGQQKVWREMKPEAQLRFVKDYIRHIYKNPEVFHLPEQLPEDHIADGPQVSRTGDKSPLLQRSIPTFEEALKMGAIPKHTNPVRTLMESQRNFERIHAAHEIAKEAESSGLVKRLMPGQRIPDGYVPVRNMPGAYRKATDAELKRAAKAGINISPTAAKRPTVAIARHQVARVLNNHFSSLDAAGPVTAAVLRGARTAKNLVTGSNLALPMVHFVVSTHEAMSSELQRGMMHALSGNIGAAMKHFASVPISPITRSIEGDAYVKHLLKGADVPPRVATFLKHYVDTNPTLNASGTMSSANLTDMASIQKAFASGTLRREFSEGARDFMRANAAGKAKIAARLALRVEKSLSEPLFEYYIPRLKATAFIDQMAHYAKANPGASEEDLASKAFDVGKFVDHTYGMKPEDNTHLHAVTRSILGSMFTSYSYVDGQARGIIGAAKGVYRGLTSPGMTRAQKADAYLMRAVASTLVTAATGAVISTVATGTPPTSLRGALYPRVDPNDPTKRGVQFDAFTKEMTNLSQETPATDASNKLSTPLHMLVDMASNKQYDGSPIAPEQDALPQKALDYLGYAGSAALPFSLQPDSRQHTLYRDAPFAINEPDRAKFLRERKQRKAALYKRIWGN